MKLAAAILFAVTNAQRDGRQREKETPASSDDAFAAYFGAGFDAYDYGAGFDNDSFGENTSDSAAYEAFGDLSFGDYDYAGANDDAVEAAVQAAVANDEANRPSNDDQPQLNTFIPGNNGAANDETNSALASYCWENSAATPSLWAKTTGAGAGAWRQCLGEGSACEVKVVRDLSTASNDIVQVVSKCANEASCVANMEQNFNPSETNDNKVYIYQQCRPLQLGSTTFTLGNRLKFNNLRSTCFFCVEPCASAPAGNTIDTSDSNENVCVGPSADGTAWSTPSNASPVDLFDEADLKVTVNPLTTANPFRDDNFYSTISGVLSNNGNSKKLKISRIQQLQIATNGVGTFTPDP